MSKLHRRTKLGGLTLALCLGVGSVSAALPPDAPLEELQEELLRVQFAYFMCDANLYAIYFDIVAAEAEIEALTEALSAAMEEISFDERGQRIVSQAEREVRADLKAAYDFHAACRNRQSVWMCEFIALAQYWQELEDRIELLQAVG